ncbi:hypothetical protein like AT5G41860 [Hibiscus trionum]|uniref:Uncharacterized protein n=1 Tax=Hibiscus trionum TaxID=183268 RepID=A0A9W7IJZ8_HIBTR|nr:hypothetical protein like AT5G41860 [Hibiscus trionum]
MARLAFLFSLILLFTVSHARFFTAESEHDDQTHTDLPESTTAILLPSERPDFKPPKLLDFKPGVGSVHFTRIRFHPVNRHFPRRPLFPYFRHKHNCRFHKRSRALNPRFHQKRFVSYGNDMILSDEERRFEPESRGVVRQIEARWGSFHDDGAESKQHVDFMMSHAQDHHQHHEEGGFMQKFRRFFIHF